MKNKIGLEHFQAYLMFVTLSGWIDFQNVAGQMNNSVKITLYL